MIPDRFSDWGADYVTVVSAADHDDPDGPYRLTILNREGAEVAIFEASGDEVMGGVVINDADEVGYLIDALEGVASGDQ